MPYMPWSYPYVHYLQPLLTAGVLDKTLALVPACAVLADMEDRTANPGMLQYLVACILLQPGAVSP